MKYYAVIDTNVMVSAMIKFESVPGAILRLTFGGTIIPILNKEIAEEYRTVLKREKFNFPSDVVETVVGELERIAVFVDAEKTELGLPDIKDTVFYEVVLKKRESGDAYLVTGNIRHFPVKPFVVTPKQMLDIVFNDTEL